MVNLGFGNKCGVDVSRVPIEELVAVVGGDAPSLFRGRHTQLAVEGQVVGHVHFRGIPEKPELQLKFHLIHNNMVMLSLCLQKEAHPSFIYHLIAILTIPF